MILEGNSVVGSGRVCLRFNYNMNGFHVGALSVYIVENGVRKEKWRLVGDQLQNWRPAAADLNMDGVSQVGLEAVTTGEFSGDIAVDNIQFSQGRCISIQH